MPDPSSKNPLRFLRFSRAQNERGVALITTAVMMVFVVPMVGLSIDVGILYAVKSKLSMACDAGALAGARALSRGLDDVTQQTNAKNIAKQYVQLNFPANYFGTGTPTIPDPVIDETVANQRSVSVTATVSVPLYFLRWLGSSTTPGNSSAVAVRRDVNVMVVMDRSGSLANSGSCAPLQQAAINFVNRFANGRDNVGLVTFATSSLVDFPIGNNFLSASPNIPTILGELTCTGGTSSAEGLWLGYQQLASLNQPNALNVLLFFTDGYPTALTATFPIQSSSSCSDRNPKVGVLTAGFYASDPLTPVAVGGLFDFNGPVQPATSDANIGPTTSNGYSNCAYAQYWPGSSWNVTSDISYVPTTDYYGNAMTTNYQSVTYSGSNIGLDPWSVMNASVNAADSAALRIRTGATGNGVTHSIPNVRMYSIGLGNAGGVPADFLERVANDPRASNFNSTYPSGLYIYSPSSSDLNSAFLQIAAQILHIAK